MEVRWQSTQADLEDINRVLSDVYRRGEPFESRELDPDEIGAIVRVQGEPVGTFLVMNMQTTRRTATLRGAGVAAVAIMPEQRHHGYGTQMMTWSLRAMRDHGYDVACLYAYRETYYRRFGYEVAGSRVLIECPRDRLPRFEPTLPIRRILPDEIHLLDPALKAYGERHSGANLRCAANWKRRLGKNPPMIYAFGDPVRAYCWTSMEGGFWEDLSMGEFIYADREGMENLLAFMRTLAINRNTLSWTESSASPYLASLLDGNVKVSSHRPTMWRLLNIPQALSKLKCERKGEFQVAIHDPLLSENSHTWRVVFGPDGVSCEVGNEADFSMSVSAFTQAFLGEPSLSRLGDLGFVDVKSPLKLAEAELLLTPTPTLCTEYF